MASPDLYLHALRQRLERRRGRTLTVRYGTLARQPAGGSSAATTECVARRRHARQPHQLVSVRRYHCHDRHRGYELPGSPPRPEPTTAAATA
jgi:hypothetical protein